MNEVNSYNSVVLINYAILIHLKPKFDSIDINQVLKGIEA